MNNNKSSSNFCKGIKQLLLIALFISFFVAFYSLDQSILSIGSLNRNITNLNNQDSNSMKCIDLCIQLYTDPYGDGQCCINSTIFSTCKTKQECKLEIITHNQNELNTQYLNLLLDSGVILFFIIVVAVYCVKKRIERAKRMRQAQENLLDQQNSHAALFNYVGTLHIRQEFQPASLDSSFLFNENNEHACSICLQGLLEAKAIKLKCDHIFHSQCIKSWMQTKNTCPICRTRN